jgi:hypothetical protein
MRRRSYRRVVHMQIVTNGADHHFPSIEPHADAEFEALMPSHLFGIIPHRRLHGQRRIAGTDRMIFMGNRRAKQGHNAVAQDLIHGTLKAVYGVHHDVDSGIKQLLGSFWIEVFDQLGGVFDVGKQDGDVLAFAFEGAAGGEDFLSEIGRCIGEW